MLAAVAFLAPFHLKITTEAWTDLGLRPLVVLALAASIVLAVRALVGGGGRPDRFDALAWWWLGAVWLSALLSASPTLGAGGAARLSVAALLIPATRHVARTEADKTIVLRALVAGGFLAALVGLGYAWFGADGDPTRFFVGQVTRLGPFDRLTRPWSHANVAAMALGVTLPAVAVIRNRYLRAGAAAVLVVALVSTISRGGLLVLGSLAIVWVVLRRDRREALAIGGLVALAAATFLLSGAWGVRIDSLGDRAFYAGRVEPPSELVLDGGDVLVEVDVANDSSVTWPSAGRDRVLISARWIGPDGLVWTEDRWSLPRDLPAGDELTAPLSVTTRLPVGEYTLRWDLLIDQQAYFDQFLGEAPVTSTGTIDRSDVAIEDLFRYDLVERRLDLGRVEGWRLAWQDFRSSPVVGVGPNQFADRAEAQLAEDGRTIGAHAHNVVLEPLAAWGLFGAVPFLALGAAALQSALTRAWRTRTTVDAVVASGLVAMLVHGAVDWPLVGVSTCIPVGVLVGLALAGHSSTPD